VSITGLITSYLSLRLLVGSGFINISNEVGRVKSVSLFFYFFLTHSTAVQSRCFL